MKKYTIETEDRQGGRMNYKLISELFGGIVPSKLHDAMVTNDGRFKNNFEPTDAEIVADIKQRNIDFCGHE